MEPASAILGSSAVDMAGGFIQGHLNRKEAERNRRFQARMSSSAHVRETKDLRKAGLNPMISAMKTGSSTPGGAVGLQGQIGGTAVNSAVAYQQSKAIQSQIALNSAQAYKTQQEAKLIRSQVPKAQLKQKLWEIPENIFDKNKNETLNKKAKIRAEKLRQKAKTKRFKKLKNKPKPMYKHPLTY